MAGDYVTRATRLARELRRQVIEACVKADCIRNRAPIPGDVEMSFIVGEIYRLPCATRILDRLFADAHDYHAEIGMMPHAASVQDLEYCIRNRAVGYRSTQNVRHPWLAPARMQMLTAAKELDALYREAGSVIAPVTKTSVKRIAQDAPAVTLKAIAV